MKLASASIEILTQLKAAIVQLNDADFCQKVNILNNSTIGQHTRHTLEFFICLKNSLNSGAVNYDNREHDEVIETDKSLCIIVIDEICDYLSSIHNNTPLELHANYNLSNNEIIVVASNLFRELAYNIEHAIHHMAIIKIGLKEVAPYVSIPENFGVAISTLKHKKAVDSN